jgi:hypothetical protein
MSSAMLMFGEDIQRDMSDDLRNLSVCETLIAQRLYAAGRHLSAFSHQFAGERQRRCGLG